MTDTALSPANDGEGERRKREALSLLQSHRAVFVRRGRRALLLRLLAAGEATADAVRAGVILPPVLNPKLFGAVPGPLAKAKIIRPAGFVRTARPEGRARPVTVWALADRAAALAWLSANPEITEPDADAPAQRTLFDSPTEPGEDKPPGSQWRNSQ